MSERNYVSNRVLLCNASIDVIKDKYEAEILYEYRSMVNKIEEAHTEIQRLSKQSNASSSIKKIENQIVQYNIQLSRMESEYPLQNVIQRMRGNEHVEQKEISRVKQEPKEVQQKKSDKPQKDFGEKMKHLNKRTIIIALCVILGIAVIASTVALISTIGSEENEHTITFYNNRGIYFYTNGYGEERRVTTYQDSSVYKVEKFSGRYPSEPTPPKNGEYVFLGWYKNPECTDKFLFGEDEVNSNINLYAKWGK